MVTTLLSPLVQAVVEMRARGSQLPTARSGATEPGERSLLPLADAPGTDRLPWLEEDGNASLTDALERLQGMLAAREEELAAVYASTAWRLTRPVRAVGTVKRRVSQWQEYADSGRLRLAANLLRRGDVRGLADRARAMHRYRSALAATTLTSTTPGLGAVVTQEPWPKHQPLISVVVPCFNYGHFLRECLDSLSRQTFPHFEIIVVDGGSTDPASIEATRQLEAEGVGARFYYREGRHLLGCNRNFGIEHARGRYVLSLDPDDKLAPIYLEMAAYLLEAENYDVVGASVQHFGDRHDQWLVRPKPTLSDVIHENVTTSTAVFRRALWAAAGGYHDTGLGEELIYEDWKFWVRVMALGARLYNVQSTLFYYRKHDASQSSHARIPALDVQRRAIAEYNADVLTSEAFARSQRRASTNYEVRNPFVNLLSDAPEQQPAVLVCLPFLPRAGAQKVVSDVTRRLSAVGFRIVVLTSIPDDTAAGSAEEWFRDHTDEIYKLPELLEPQWWQSFTSYLIEAKKVEAVWVIGSEYAYSQLSYLRRRHPGIKVVDSLFILGTHLYRNRDLRESIDLTVAESRELERYLLESGEAPERVWRIPNGVDAQKWRPKAAPEAAMRALSSRAQGRFVVGFASRLADEKSPDTFLDIAAAFGDVDPFHFVMLGGGPLARHVESRVRRRPLAGRVDLVGVVDDPSDYYACFDVLVLPSVLEGRPNIVLECMAMGIPVIASAVGGVPELVEHLRTGYLCQPGDVNGFVRALRALQSDPLQRKHMSQAARLAAEAQHSAARSVEAYVGMFQELIAPAMVSPRQLSPDDAAASSPGF